MCSVVALIPHIIALVANVAMDIISFYSTFIPHIALVANVPVVAFIPHIIALIANVPHSCIHSTYYCISCKCAPWLLLFHILVALVANVHGCFYLCISCMPHAFIPHITCIVQMCAIVVLHIIICKCAS